MYNLINQSFKMNTANMNYYETSKNVNLSKRITMLEFICLISYLYVYYIIYKRTNAYFNTKIEEDKLEEVKVEEVKEKVEEVKVEEVKVKLEAVASSSEVEKKDVNTWYTIEDGKARYKGEWKNGLPNGKGIKHYYKTDSYIEGNFVDSFAHGYGKQTFEKTQTWEKTVPYYEGEFNRNNYDGKGEYHYGDGDYYKGDWKDSKYNGQGAAYSKRLDRTWVGEYENDVKGEGNWVKGEI